MQNSGSNKKNGKVEYENSHYSYTPNGKASSDVDKYKSILDRINNTYGKTSTNSGVYQIKSKIQGNPNRSG